MLRYPEAKPHIDTLAQDGVQFTQHYSNGTECSPTRTAFLTDATHEAGGLECAIGTGNVGRYDDAICLAGARQLGLLPSRRSSNALQQRVILRNLCKWHLGYEPHQSGTRMG